LGTTGDDEVSFDSFFRAEGDKLVAQAYLLVGDLPAAQDLAQRVLERAWQHWPRVRRYERPAAWARRVLYNMALNEHRRRGRQRALPIAGYQIVDGPSEPHIALVQALRGLPVDQRKAIVLHDGAGIPVAEVATDLGVPEGTVKSWLSRGRAKLAEALSDEDEEEVTK
jgi:RNA polymerase sigma-70 factor (ECF subfamily)